MPENLLLACLSTEARNAFRPHCKEVKLSPGSVLAAVGERVASVYFPSSGAVSLVVEMSCGNTVETAMIGRDGAVNALACLDGTQAFSKAVVLLPGTALSIEVERLREFADQYKEVRQLLVRHGQVLIGEIQQAAACNIIDDVEARLARWLLRASDLAEKDGLPLTHEAIAEMLGVRRPSVSVVAGTLQRAGMIRHRRGHVQILDREALENSACECYATVRDHYGRLLHRESY